MRSLRLRSTALLMLTTLALLAASLLLDRPVVAFSVRVVQTGSPTVVHWFSNTIQYFLNVDGCKTAVKNGCKNLPPDKTFEQWNAGFAAWTATECTSLKFQQGYHCNTGLGKCGYDKNVGCKVDADCPAAHNTKLVVTGYNTNGRNELAFVATSDWTFGDFVLGVTSPVTQNNGAIIEADIAFNGYLQMWTPTATQTDQDTQHLASVALHEEGHFFGVQHVLGSINQNDPPTMAPYVDPYGKTASLNDDDVKVACFMHPKGGVYTCKNDSDCPWVVDHDKNTDKEAYAAKFACSGGKCSLGGIPVGGGAALGGTCNTDDDCLSGICQPYGAGAFCSQLCEVSKANCPANFACYPYQNGGGKGACMAGKVQPAPSKNAGEACAASSECKSLMCLKNVCRTQCAPKKPVQCTADEQCSAIPGTSIGACVPKPPPPAKAAVGELCDGDDHCASNICLKADLQADFGQCRQKCEAKGTCPEGQACLLQPEGYSACMPGSDKVGAGSACSGPSDCDTNLCVSDGKTNFCSKYCLEGDATTCPCGMQCKNTSSGALCIGQKTACCSLGDGANPCAAGQGCLRTGAGPLGTCGKVGAGQLADKCATDSDCASLYCAPDASQGGVKTCQTACNPSADQCGAGRVCETSSGAPVGRCVFGPTGGADGGGLAGDAGTGSVAGAITQNTAQPSGCSASRSGRLGWAWLGLLAVGAVLGRRRGVVQNRCSLKV